MTLDDIINRLLFEILRYAELTGDKDPCILLHYDLFHKIVAAYRQNTLITMNKTLIFGYEFIAAPLEPGTFVIGHKTDYGSETIKEFYERRP